MKVRDITGKESLNGSIAEILSRYNDGFPWIVRVNWDNRFSVEFVIHPNEDDFLMEGLVFLCPRCKKQFIESYNLVGENKCTYCDHIIWTEMSNIPIIKEPLEVIQSLEELGNSDNLADRMINVSSLEKKVSSSKFTHLERMNWGASPGARKLMLGEFFTKMRLYKLPQPLVAQYLTLLRKSKSLTVQDIINKLPKRYTHTVGHWFRKDLGGSIPIPEDIHLLRKLTGLESSFFNILERTALKFQTVKSSVKGRNPGDFIEMNSDSEVVNLFKLLYLPPNEYVKNIIE